MSIENIIYNKRKELNLTYEELGNLVGVGKSTIRKWEIGMIKNIKKDNIIALSKVFKISPSQLLDSEYSKDNIKTINLSNEEILLISIFKNLNNKNKNKIINLAKLLSLEEKN